MTYLRCTLLAIALSASAGAAAAQEYARPYGDAPYGDYSHREFRGGYRGDDDYRDGGEIGPYRAQGGQSDWARVLRVDPVFRAGGRDVATAGRRNCVTRQDGYVVTDPHRGDRHARDPYRNDPYGRDPYRNDGYRDGTYRDAYGDRGYGRDPYRDDPYRDSRRDDSGRMVATVLGGIAGAVLGSKVGNGSGQYVGTAVGTMVGGMAGRGIYDANRRQREVREGYVTTCDPEPYYEDGDGYGGRYASDRAITEYDVTYEYAGRQYVTRTDYHPGDRIRVRVDVRAE